MFYVFVFLLLWAKLSEINMMMMMMMMMNDVSSPSESWRNPAAKRSWCKIGTTFYFKIKTIFVL